MIHFKSLPAFVLNLDRSADRLVKFMSTHANVFDSITRVQAVEGRDLSLSEVRDFTARSNALVWEIAAATNCPTDKRGLKDGLRKMTALDRVKENSTGFKHMAGWAGLYAGHLKMLSQAIESKHPRFILLEDDAEIRTTFNDIDVPAADIILWGSVNMASHKTDAARYTRNDKSLSFVKPQERSQALLATATEYTRESAIRVYEVLTTLCGQWDLVWWEALKHEHVIKSVPMVFVQTSVSVRRVFRPCSICGANAYARHRPPCRPQ